MQRYRHDQPGEHDRAEHVDDPRYGHTSASGGTQGQHEKNEDRPDYRRRQGGPQNRDERGGDR